MAAPYILARTLKEAHAYARGVLGLTVGHYRVVNSAATVKSVRNVDLHLVPGWQNRYDRFAMKSALRWTRMNVIEAPKETPLTPPPSDTVPETSDGLEPEGVQLSIDEMLDLGTEVVAEVELKAEETEEVESREDEEPSSEPTPPVVDPTVEEKTDEPDEKKPRRRRRRCKECGELVDPDDVETHAATHEDEPSGSA